VQPYIGSYGAMTHPVGACHRGGVRRGRRRRDPAGQGRAGGSGGFDDLTLGAITGFGDMAATADTAMTQVAEAETPPAAPTT
jgi:fatty acid synthase, bacteria type